MHQSSRSHQPMQPFPVSCRLEPSVRQSVRLCPSNLFAAQTKSNTTALAMLAAFQRRSLTLAPALPSHVCVPLSLPLCAVVARRTSIRALLPVRVSRAAHPASVALTAAALLQIGQFVDMMVRLTLMSARLSVLVHSPTILAHVTSVWVPVCARIPLTQSV